MRIERVTVTRAATVPTGQFANQRIEISWEALLDEGEAATIQTPLLLDKLDDELLLRIAVIKAEHGQDNYSAQPTASGVRPDQLRQGGVRK